MHNATIQHSSYLTSVATPKLPVGKTVADPGFTSYIATAYRDGTLKLIHRYTYQVLQSGVMDTFYNPSIGSSPSKKQKKLVNITNLVQTLSGCGLIAVHDGKFSVMKVFNSKDSPVMMSASYVCLLLEYILVTGQDWWDVLLAIKAGRLIESVTCVWPRSMYLSRGWYVVTNPSRGFSRDWDVTTDHPRLRYIYRG